MRLKSLLTAWFLPPIKVLRLQPGNIQIFFVSWTDGVLLMSHHQALSPTLSTFFVVVSCIFLIFSLIFILYI